MLKGAVPGDAGTLDTDAGRHVAKEVPPGGEGLSGSRTVGGTEGEDCQVPEAGMEGKECKIGVWVYQEEKLVSGLSRRTSCQDVIAALLEDAGLSDLLSGALDTYSLVEKWRGLERTLPNKTKVLRLWAAWGEERHNVTLVLEKTRVELGSTGPRSAQAKVVASKGKAGNPGNPGNPGKAGSTTAMSRDKHRRVVRKAFRKLAKMKRCKRQESGGEGGEGGERMETLVHLVLSQDHTIRWQGGEGGESWQGGEGGERMETLVHLVLSQDHTIRQQLQRLRALDRDIERCEATVHQDRIREHGANYVQDTYLEGGGGGIEGEEGPADGVPLLEAAVLLDQLDTSVSAGQRLDSELETCALELEQSRAARDHQRGEIDRLLGELRQAQRTVQAPQPPGWTPTGCPAATGTDDSDTGLSSMNSLDSDATPVSESLV